MYPGYEQDRRHALKEEFRFKARVSKVGYSLLAFIVGFMFLPFMAAWDGGTDTLQRDFNPVDGVGWLLIALFTLVGILSAIMAWLAVRNWEYHCAPFGYDTGKLW